MEKQYARRDLLTHAGLVSAAYLMSSMSETIGAPTSVSDGPRARALIQSHGRKFDRQHTHKGGPIMIHGLPELPYEFNALEPFIDEQTMRIHHGKHHAGYVSKLNAALGNHPDLAAQPIEKLLGNLGDVPEDARTAIRNSGGGHYNHSLFWPSLAPQGQGGEPAGALADAFDQEMGGFDRFKDIFTKAAAGVFGSGWAWLCIDSEGRLRIGSTPNQDSPIMRGVVSSIATPLLGLDVWEHAYYLKYQNRRADYIEAWWHVVNWKVVGQRYAEARAGLHAEVPQ
jgi:Fe-Mn family superoxide dismutase